MSDPFQGHAPGLTAPASRGFAVTPNDAADLARVSRGIYVGEGGDLRVLLANDDVPVTFPGLAGGMIHGLRLRRVFATGTTATGLVGVF